MSTATPTGVIGELNANAITGCVLAGGLARRMGGIDKGLIPLNERPMAAYIVDALRPQVSALLISANRNLDTYAALGGCPVVPDQVDGFAGPLAGIASAMGRAATSYLVTAPCDSPLLAEDYVARLSRSVTAHKAEIGVARGAGRLQPVFALLDCSLLPSLMAYLQAGERKIDRWYARHRVSEVDFHDCEDMFLNINTPAERDLMEQRLK